MVVESTWPTLRSRLGLSDTSNRWIGCLAEMAYRAILLVAECKRESRAANQRIYFQCSSPPSLQLVFQLPNKTIKKFFQLDELIPLIGASVGCLLALIFPVIIHSLTCAPTLLERRQKNGAWRLPLFRLVAVNALIIAIGVACGVAGTIYNIEQIIRRYF